MADIKVAGPLEVPVAHAADTGAPRLVLVCGGHGRRMEVDDEHIVRCRVRDRGRRIAESSSLAGIYAVEGEELFSTICIPRILRPHHRWLDLEAGEAAMAWARLWSRVTPHPI